MREIGDGAFSDCCSLEEVRLPEGLECIGRQAFSGCQKLESVLIPRSVRKIDSCAFDRRRGLRIYYSGSRDEWRLIVPGDDPTCSEGPSVLYYYRCEGPRALRIFDAVDLKDDLWIYGEDGKPMGLREKTGGR